MSLLRSYCNLDFEVQNYNIIIEIHLCKFNLEQPDLSFQRFLERTVCRYIHHILTDEYRIWLMYT